MGEWQGRTAWSLGLVACALFVTAACGNIARLDGKDAGVGDDASQPDDADPGEDALMSYTLTVVKGGTGTGTVTSTAGIDCGTDCSEEVVAGTMVTLTAAADADSTFVGWSGGGCSGTATCELTVTAAVTVTAMFALDNTLEVMRMGNGSGTVTSTPAGIDCGTDCSEQFPPDTPVTLTAAPDVGSNFAGWGGACSGMGTCSVMSNSALLVTASFALKQYTVEVDKFGTGTGTVKSTDGTLDCGSNCSEVYNHNTMVELKAEADVGSEFLGWSGGGCSGTGTCKYMVDSDVVISAKFEKLTYAVSVEVKGKGEVRSVSGKIDCPGTCKTEVEQGAQITLVPVITDREGFAGWDGACTGLDDCVLTITADTTVSATFDEPNVAFVTSTTTTGKMGGLPGADAICQKRAEDASLQGTYVALLSTKTVSAVSRLGTARGWSRTDGKAFADTTTDLFGPGSLFFYPLRLDEFGEDRGAVSVFTGTDPNGMPHQNSGEICTGWTTEDQSGVDVGLAASQGGLWVASEALQCKATAHLYCFGVDKQVRMRPPQPETSNVRRAFTAPWTPGGGIDAADAVCKAAASSAGLPGSYKALLATNGASAISRFTTNGAPWYRVDDVLVLPTAAEWVSPTLFDASPSLKADGSVQLGNNVLWGGAEALNKPGSLASTCDNWMKQTLTAMHGHVGYNAAAKFFTGTTTSCSSQIGHIVCLQE